jgi:hypothetical protein
MKKILITAALVGVATTVFILYMKNRYIAPFAGDEENDEYDEHQTMFDYYGSPVRTIDELGYQ